MDALVGCSAAALPECLPSWRGSVALCVIAFVTADAEAVVNGGRSSARECPCASGRVRVDGRRGRRRCGRRVRHRGLGSDASNSAAVGRGARKAQRWEPSQDRLQLTLDVVQRQLPPPWSARSLVGVDLASTSSVGFEHVEPVLDAGSVTHTPGSVGFPVPLPAAHPGCNHDALLFSSRHSGQRQARAGAERTAEAT